MSDIFLSYAREDEVPAVALAQLLQDAGWSVFWDHKIPAGMTWRDYIGNALARTRLVIVLWTARSVRSQWVLEEADEARQRGILLPVMMEAIAPPLGFRQVQAADLTGASLTPGSPQVRQLLSDVEAHLGKPARPADAVPVTQGVREERPTASQPVPQPVKRMGSATMMAAVLVAGALALAIVVALQDSAKNGSVLSQAGSGGAPRPSAVDLGTRPVAEDAGSLPGAVPPVPVVPIAPRTPSRPAAAAAPPDAPGSNQAAWVAGPLFGADNEVAAARRVTIRATGGTYQVHVQNQFGFTCALDFDPAGNPRRVSNCTSAPSQWKMDEREVLLRCDRSRSAGEMVCSGKYTLRNGDYAQAAVLRIGRRTGK